MRHYIIIIGAMKSGTTTLFDILALHPAIAPATNKEPGFFAFEEIWEKGFDWFDTMFEDFDPTQHRYRLEASTDYTKAPFVSNVWERMTANPDVSVKLLYIMRHPLRRFESHARHVQSARKELGQRISPIVDHGLDAGMSPVNLATSRYASQLDAFGEARAAGNLHCLTLEGLREDPAGTLQAVFEFLELDAKAGEADLPVSNAASDLTRVHPFWETLVKARPLMTFGKMLLPQGVRNAITARASQKVKSEGRFSLSDEETAFLEEIYADEMQQLRDNYGIETEKFWKL